MFTAFLHILISATPWSLQPKLLPVTTLVNSYPLLMSSGQVRHYYLLRPLAFASWKAWQHPGLFAQFRIALPVDTWIVSIHLEDHSLQLGNFSKWFVEIFIHFILYIRHSVPDPQKIVLSISLSSVLAPQALSGERRTQIRVAFADVWYREREINLKGQWSGLIYVYSVRVLKRLRDSY